MKSKWRKKIVRIKPVHHLARLLMYNSGWFFYRKIYKERRYDSLFAEMKDSKHGKRCFIIGNGPSLQAEDLDKLRDEDCFAANGIYHIFQSTSWRPTYYLIMDRYCNAEPEMIRNLESNIVFLGDYYWRFNKVLRDDAICLHQYIPFIQKSYSVSQDISKKVVNTYTVSFVAMQIAAYLGYKEIYLLGFDHHYEFELDKKGRIIKSVDTKEHFFQDYNPNTYASNVIGMTKSYMAFHTYAKEHNITIKNATRGGKLEVFERVDFDNLFQKN